MSKKPITPYERLRSEASKIILEVVKAKIDIRRMFNPLITTEGRTWGLEDVRQRILAAQQLGYEVIVTASDDGTITFSYRAKHDITRPIWCYRKDGE